MAAGAGLGADLGQDRRMGRQFDQRGTSAGGLHGQSVERRALGGETIAGCVTGGCRFGHRRQPGGQEGGEADRHDLACQQANPCQRHDRRELGDRLQSRRVRGAHHFTGAGLDDLAIEWWGKAGDQALRRSAFQEAIAHLGKAIAMADKTQGGRGAGVSDQQRQLQIVYGNALMSARGYGAQEPPASWPKAT
jgi:hypothetical protein